MCVNKKWQSQFFFPHCLLSKYTIFFLISIINSLIQTCQVNNKVSIQIHNPKYKKLKFKVHKTEVKVKINNIIKFAPFNVSWSGIHL